MMFRSKTARLLMALLGVSLVPALARAQSEGGFVPAPASPPPLVSVPASETPSAHEAEAPFGGDTQHQVSITVSPLHLIIPMLELSGEYRVDDKIGVAGILGGGRSRADPGSGARFSILEAGMQARYYPVGYFEHGMQIGAELLFVYINGDAGPGISASGGGLSIAPFLGYKIAANVGFTFEIQLGASYTLVTARATSGSTSASATQGGLGVLLNLNLGWSF